jgi:outer membrane protein, heavy metal efflux system
MKWSFACAASACLMSFNAAASELPPQPASGSALSLEQAVSAALERNPELQAFAFELKATAARRQQSVLGPAPELSLDIEDFAGSGRVRGVDAAQTTLAMSQVIELGGKRAARIAASDADLDVLEVERQSRQLDVLAEVLRRYLHVASDQEQLLLTRRATELGRQTVDAAEVRLAAAKAPEVEVRRARIALARAELEEEHAEHELLSSRRKLSAMWGEPEPTFESVAANLYQLPTLGDFEILVGNLEQNPDRLRFLTRARSDLTANAGVRRLQESRDHALVFGVSVPLFSGSRAESAIQEAQTRREQTNAEQRAHRINAQTQLFELYQELRHALTEAETLRDKVLPEMEAALSATRHAFERGRYSYLEWVEAQRELISIRRALIDAARNAHLYRTEIERLTAASLPSPQP